MIRVERPGVHHACHVMQAPRLSRTRHKYTITLAISLDGEAPLDVNRIITSELGTGASYAPMDIEVDGLCVIGSGMAVESIHNCPILSLQWLRKTEDLTKRQF